MPHRNLKPTHTPINAYYETPARFGAARFDNEGNIRGAFEDLLKACARQLRLTLFTEYQLTLTGKHPLRIHTALLNEFNLAQGFREAKDSKDDFRPEAEKKMALGYPAPTSSSKPPPTPCSSKTTASNSTGKSPNP